MSRRPLGRNSWVQIILIIRSALMEIRVGMASEKRLFVQTGLLTYGGKARNS